jgi:hypothetical protein
MTEDEEGGNTSATAGTRGNTSATAATTRTNGALVPKVGPCFLSPSLFCLVSLLFLNRITDVVKLSSVTEKETTGI